MAPVLHTKVSSFVIILVGVSIRAYLASAQITDQPASTPTGTLPMSPTGPPAVSPVPRLEDNEDCFTDDVYHACAPGRYLCVGADGRTDCCICPLNTFQPAYNQCPTCVACRDCKKLHKMTAVPCNISQDTICGKKLPLTTTEATQVPTEAFPGTPAVADGTCPPCPDCNCSACCPEQQCTPSGDSWWHHPITTIIITIILVTVISIAILGVIFPGAPKAIHEFILRAVNSLRGLQLVSPAP